MFLWQSGTPAAPKQCLVLDIDETLVHTYVDNETKPAQAVLDDPALKGQVYTITTREGTYWGVKRPHLDEFLDFAYKHFDAVAFWSAGKEGYVNAVVEVIAPNRPSAFVLNRSHCDEIHDEHVASDGTVSYMPRLWKPLNMVFGNSNYPQFTRYNTWVLDDRRDYAAENLLNWLEIPPYAPNAKKLLPYDDDYLLQLIDWFRSPEVVGSSNVLEVNKDWHA